MRLVKAQILRVRGFDPRPLLDFCYVVGGLAQVVERSIRIRLLGGSMPPISTEIVALLGRCDGVVNVTDLKSVPFGGAGSNPANVFFWGFLSSVGRALC